MNEKADAWLRFLIGVTALVLLTVCIVIMSPLWAAIWLVRQIREVR